MPKLDIRTNESSQEKDPGLASQFLSRLTRLTDVRVLNSRLERIPAKCRHPGEMLAVDLYVPNGTVGYLAENEECWIEYNEAQQTYVLHGSVLYVDDRMRRARVRVDPGSLKEAMAQSGRREIRYPCSVNGTLMISPPHPQAGAEFKGKIEDISKRGAGIVIGKQGMPHLPTGDQGHADDQALFWSAALQEAATVWLSLDLPDMAAPGGAGTFQVKIRSAVRSCQALSWFAHNDRLRLSLEYDSHKESYPNPDHMSRMAAFVDFLKRYVWNA